MNKHIIITGDVIHSRSHAVGEWMPMLEQSLKRYASNFDIFRGDSFQAEVPFSKVFEAVFHLKASLRTFEQMDVRLGIGMGAISYPDSDIKKSSGKAFVYSGEAFDQLGKETIAFKSEHTELDAQLNLIMSLSALLLEQWTVNLSETVLAAIENPSANQIELTQVIGRKHQSQVSVELSKANYPKIQQVIQYCTQVIEKYA